MEFFAPEKSMAKLPVAPFFCESGTQNMVHNYLFFERGRGCNVGTLCIYAPKQKSLHTLLALSELLAGKYPEAWKSGGEQRKYSHGTRKHTPEKGDEPKLETIIFRLKYLVGK